MPSGNAGQVLGALAPAGPRILPTDLSVSKDGTFLLTADIRVAFLWRLDPDFGQSSILSANGGPFSSLLYDARFSTDGSEQLLSGDGYVALSTSTDDIPADGGLTLLIAPSIQRWPSTTPQGGRASGVGL